MFDTFLEKVRVKHVVDCENTNLALMADLHTINKAEAALEELAAQVDVARIAVRMGRLRLKEVARWQPKEILDMETRALMGIDYPELSLPEGLRSELEQRLLDIFLQRYEKALSQLQAEQRKTFKHSTRISLGCLPNNKILVEVRTDWGDKKANEES